MIDGVAARLLRSHVADGSHHEARRCCRRSGPVGGGSDASRQPEVENLDVTVARDDDVCRLEIAVHDAAIVGGSERARDLRAVLHGLANGQRSAGDDIGERFSFEKLRDRIRVCAVASDVEDSEDVGMGDAGQRLHLALEARERIRIVGKRRREDLDRDVAAKAGVLGTVDLAHATRSEGRNDLVSPKSGATAESHGSHSRGNSVQEIGRGPMSPP